jgi:hypothetical protein
MGRIRQSFALGRQRATGQPNTHSDRACAGKSHHEACWQQQAVAHWRADAELVLRPTVLARPSELN